MPYPHDPQLRDSTLELLGDTWAKLAPAITRARAWGTDWCELSTPFVEHLDGQVAAHVGVIEIPLCIDGQLRRMAGIHAVCTRPELRRRGLMRTLMQRALAWTDQHFDGAMLWAVDARVYAPFGFVAQQESMFVGPVRGGPLRAQPLSLERPEDLALLRERLNRRMPISAQCGVPGAADLALMDLALWWPGPQLALLPALDCVVVYGVRDRYLDLYDVICERLVTLADIAAQLGERIETAVVYMSPDRLSAAQLRPEPTVLFDTLMLRGQRLREPLALPTLSRC